ncbi:MAG: small conductance mechanosensitive channel [Rhodothermales bacterium]|jgi:small conductance mechanosensitive channel
MDPDSENPALTDSPLAEGAVNADGTDSMVEQGLNAILPDLNILQGLIDELIKFGTTYTFQLIGAAIILFMGAMLARFGGFFFMRWFRRRDLDITMSKFIVSCIRWIVVGFALIIALGKFGITITPFVAALGALTFGASLAVQGPVSNFTSGLIIIFTRPFVIRDTISVNGSSGIVEEIKLGYTRMTDEDGVTIIVPNKEIIGEVIINSTDWRLVEGSVGISYQDDPERAIAVVNSVLAKTEGVVSNELSVVGLEAFADSALAIAYRYRVESRHFFETSYRVNLAVHKALQQASLTIPFPQRDVHLYQANSKD